MEVLERDHTPTAAGEVRKGIILKAEYPAGAKLPKHAVGIHTMCQVELGGQRVWLTYLDGYMPTDPILLRSNRGQTWIVRDTDYQALVGPFHSRRKAMETLNMMRGLCPDLINDWLPAYGW